MVIELTRKKVLIFLSLLVVVVAIPLTVYLSQNNQDNRSRASNTSDETVVATFDGEQITQGQVREVASENIDPAAIDTQALKDALETLIERKILDREATNVGVTADADRVSALVNDNGLSETEANYQTLKEEVILGVIKSRRAISIEFWNPIDAGINSLTTEEKQAAVKQLADGNPALAEAEAGLKSGNDAFDIGDSLLKKYPSLVPVLAVNGYILSSLGEDERYIAAAPSVHQFGDSSLDKKTLDALFSMKVGEVLRVSNTQANRGGTVFKLVTVGNDSGPLSYEAWLTKKKQTLFKNLNVL